MTHSWAHTSAISMFIWITLHEVVEEVNLEEVEEVEEVVVVVMELVTVSDYKEPGGVEDSKDSKQDECYHYEHYQGCGSWGKHESNATGMFEQCSFPEIL